MHNQSDTSRPLLLHIATVARSFFYFSQAGQLHWMQQHGFSTVVAANGDDALERFSKSSGVRTLPLHIKRAISPFFDIISICEAWHHFRLLKPLVVHAHTPKGGLVGMTAAFLAGCKVRVYHLHGLPHLTATGLKRHLLVLAEKVTCRLALEVNFVSDSIRDITVQSGICPPHKAKVLCNGSINGVDAMSRFNPENYQREMILKQLEIPQESIVIGFVGRLVNDKGVRELLISWETLRLEKDNVYLLIVGPMEAKDSISSELKSLIISDERIRYIGEVDDVAPFYAVMDVLAFPTYREGFGLVAIEASAMKVPVVATKIPGCVDAVVDAVTGILIPAGDASALKTALDRYLLDPGLRRQHGDNGRKRVISDFCPEDIWRAQFDQYIRLIQNRKIS